MAIQLYKFTYIRISFVKIWRYSFKGNLITWISLYQIVFYIKPLIKFDFFRKKEKKPDTAIRCEKCNATFQNEDMMYEHLKNAHPQKKEEGTDEKIGD